MTIEKRFEKWFRKYLLCCDCKRKCTCIQLNAYCEEQVKQAYIAGATYNKHDLQKNPEDLPKENMKQYIVLDSDGDFYMGWYCIHYDKWIDDSCDDGEKIENVVAWFELPDKE